MNGEGTMRGKICLVTGATSGIGKETALALAGKGATVVVVGRSRERCEATVAQIKAQTGNSQVEWILADLSKQADIRALAETFKQRYNQLHVLVNNAGAVFIKREETVDGLEMTFGLNHIGYFLLTVLLLDLLKASAPARIINVSSDAHRSGKMRFDDLQGQRSFNGWAAYAQSKLANVLFTYELARRLEGSRVTANVLHPGVVTTGFGVNNGFLGRVLRRLMDFVSITAVEGAQTMIYLASAPELEGVTGKYFVNKREVRSNAASYNEPDARKLWEVSEQLTQVSIPA